MTGIMALMIASTWLITMPGAAAVSIGIYLLIQLLSGILQAERWRVMGKGR